MRKEVRHAVVRELEGALSRRLAGFSFDPTAECPVGDRVYRWDVANELAIFVALQIDRKRDAFTLEVGWSRKGCWPSRIATVLPADDPVDGEQKFRLARLWCGETGIDPWWEIESEPDPEDIEAWLADEPGDTELVRRVPTLVRDAVGRLEREGMDYFAEVAKEMGVKLDSRTTVES